MTNGCPSRDELRWLLQGCLTAARYETVETHLEACSSCQGRLDRVSDEVVRSNWADWLESFRFVSTDDAGSSCGPGVLPSRHEDAIRFPPSDDPQSLGRLDSYEILAELGRGAMGVVYRAREVRLARQVAIKVPWPALVTAAEFRRRFEREARTAAAGIHEHVARIYRIGESTPEFPLPYIVLELIEGESLAERLARERTITPREAARIAREVSLGLAAAHERGLIHRDIKPSNIMIEAAGGRAKITDFGLARAVDPEDGGVTRTEGRPGSPAYMSPEHFGTIERYDARSDVYSLGVVLYEMLVGERPFRGSTPAMVMRQVIEKEPTPPRRFDDRIPRDLETICLKCLEKVPARRYESVTMLAEDLARFLDGRTVHARPVGPAGRLARAARRQPVLAALIMTVIVGTAIGVGVGAWQWSQTRAALDREHANAQLALDALGHSNRIIESLSHALMDQRKRHTEIPPKGVDEIIRSYADHLKLIRDETSPESLQILAAMALTHLNHSMMLSVSGKPDEAEAALRQALALFERRHRLMPRDGDGLFWLARTHEELARLVRAQSRWEEAVHHYERRLALLEALARIAPDEMPPLSHALAAPWIDLGGARRKNGDSARALGDLSRGIAILEEALRSDPNGPQLATLTNAYFSLARNYEELDRHDEGLEIYRRLLKILKSHPPNDPNGEKNRVDLGTCHHLIGNLYENIGRPAEAAEWFRRAADIREALVRDYPKNARYGDNLEGTRRRLAEALAAASSGS